MTPLLTKITYDVILTGEADRYEPPINTLLKHRNLWPTLVERQGHKTTWFIYVVRSADQPIIELIHNALEVCAVEIR